MSTITSTTPTSGLEAEQNNLRAMVVDCLRYASEQVSAGKVAREHGNEFYELEALANAIRYAESCAEFKRRLDYVTELLNAARTDV